MTKDFIKSYHQLRENFYLDSLTELDENPSFEEPPLPNPNVNSNIDNNQFSDFGNTDSSQIDDFESSSGSSFGEEPPKTPTELGRIYEIKKIYFRLYVIHKFLKNNSDPSLKELNVMVDQAFDIFRLILNNLKSYKDKIDQVILSFYDFISNVLIEIDKYYQAKSETQLKNSNI